MSAVDQPDAPWYHPTFLGQGAKIGEQAAAAINDWGRIAEGGALRPGHSAFQIARRPAGASQVHYVNAIDPGTAGPWLLPNVHLDNVAPARLPI